MMDGHVAGISANDISDSDLPVDYVMTVALVLIAGFGVYVCFFNKRSDSALPLGGKRRID